MFSRLWQNYNRRNKTNDVDADDVLVRWVDSPVTYELDEYHQCKVFITAVIDQHIEEYIEGEQQTAIVNTHVK